MEEYIDRWTDRRIIIMPLQPFVGPCSLFPVSWSYTQSVGLLRKGISPSQGLYLHAEQHKHRINVRNTYINAMNGIRTHDPSVRASEDGSCLRPRVHCDWQTDGYTGIKQGNVISLLFFQNKESRVKKGEDGGVYISGVHSAGWLYIHFTAATSWERVAPLTEKNDASRHHVLRSLSMHNEHRVYK
jgi:hypothetical protein